MNNHCKYFTSSPVLFEKRIAGWTWFFSERRKILAKIDNEVRKFVKSYSTSKGLRWRIIVPDGRSGQIRQRKFLDEKSALEFAKQKYTKVLLQTNRVVSSVNAKMTFAEYVEQWIHIKQQDGVACVTIKRYREQIRLYLLPYFGSFRLKELAKHHLRNYITDSLSSGISTYNLKNTVTIFKMIVRHAIEDDFMDDTSLLVVKTPKHRAKDPRFWDQREMNYFLEAVKESKWINFWKFSLWTGMRAGEIAALKWECVHLDMRSGDHVGFIKVCRTISQKTKILRETTKNGENRMIPIFPELRALICEMKQKDTGVFVFGGEKPHEPAHFSRNLEADLEKIPNLKKINFHGLRHTFCSYLDSTGMNRRIVAEIMGHRDLSTTDRYSHVSNQTLGLEVTRWFESRSKQNSSKVSLVAN